MGKQMVTPRHLRSDHGLDSRQDDYWSQWLTKTPLYAGAEVGGQSLYVSGVPGTGKTASVLEVMINAKAKAKAGTWPGFQFVEINVLRLPAPHHAYTRLLEVSLPSAHSCKRAAVLPQE